MTRPVSLFAQYALHYHSLGYNVIPLKDRICIMKGWNWWCGTRQTEDDVNMLINMCESDNDPSTWNGIGFPTGSINGIALDIDTNDEIVISHLLDIAGPSRLMRFGSKGLGLFYAWDPDLMGISAKGGVLFEVLGVGRYMAVPPSWHNKVAASYEWRTGPLGSEVLEVAVDGRADAVGLIDICEQADLTDMGGVETVERMLAWVKAEVTRRPELVPEWQRSATSANGHPTVGPNFMLTPTGRNNKLTAIAYAKASAFETEMMAAEDLVNYDRVTHVPPYFEDPTEWKGRYAEGRPQGRPLDRALAFYQRAVDKVDKESAQTLTKEEVPAECLVANTTYDGSTKDRGDVTKGGGGEDGEDMDYQDGVDCDGLDSEGDDGLNNELPFEGVKMEYIAEELQKISLEMHPLFDHGMLRHFRTYAMSKGVLDTPALHMSAAVSWLSLLAANVLDFGSTRANNNYFAIAPSGTGKSAPQNAMKDLMSAIPLASDLYSGQSGYRSVPVFYKGFERNRRHARLDIVDEVDSVFEMMAAKNSNTATLPQAIAQIWSLSNSRLMDQTTMDDKRSIKAIWNPYLVSHGSSTLSQIRQWITPQLIRQGLIPRALWFVDMPKLDELDSVSRLYGFEDDGDSGDGTGDGDGGRDSDKARARAVAASFEHLRTVSTYWLSIEPSQAGQANGMPNVYNSPQGSEGRLVARALKPTKEAKARLLYLQNDALRTVQHMEANGNPMAARVNRKVEHIRKLAILHWLATKGEQEAMSAINCGWGTTGGFEAVIGAPKNSELGLESVEWGEKLFDLCDRMFTCLMSIGSAQTGVGLTPTAILREVERELGSWLKEFGKKGEQERRIKQRFYRLIDKYDTEGHVIRDRGRCYMTLRQQNLTVGQWAMVKSTSNFGARLRFVGR